MVSDLTTEDGEQEKQPITVCVIGYGPGGMSLAHAHSIRKQKLDFNSEEYKCLPEITIYERASKPGGVWRSVPDDDVERKRPENIVLQYEDLWLNAPKEMFEYFDYTYQDHFNEATPAWLPRQDVLEYITARNTMYKEDQEYVKFRHSVLDVYFDEKISKFLVNVRNEETGVTTNHVYDRCVYAGGSNSKPIVPQRISSMLSNEYKGKWYHSVQATECFKEDVHKKRIMIVGDSSSAEDLSLRAIKHGAEKVYIISRSGNGDAVYMSAWPYGKVEIIEGEISRVIGDKNFEVSGNWETYQTSQYESDSDDESSCSDEENSDSGKASQQYIENIDLVLLCTGYEAAYNFLPSNLCPDKDARFKVQKDWKMKQNGNTVGEVTPSKSLYAFCHHPEMYDNMLIHNPNMMFLMEGETEIPMFFLEIKAWLILAYLVGDITVPDRSCMQKATQERLEEDMHTHYFRYEMDSRYYSYVWECDEENSCVDQYTLSWMAVYSRIMRKGNYPLDFGTNTNMTEAGKTFFKNNYIADQGRQVIDKDRAKEGYTFRDSEYAEYRSHLTGEACLPLRKKWLETIAKDGDPTKCLLLKNTV